MKFTQNKMSARTGRQTHRPTGRLTLASRRRHVFLGAVGSLSVPRRGHGPLDDARGVSPALGFDAARARRTTLCPPCPLGHGADIIPVCSAQLDFFYF